MPNGDNDYNAILNELHKNLTDIVEKKKKKKKQFENLYIINSKGNNLRISHIQTSLVVSGYRMK